MNHCTKEQLIAFENRVKALWEAGELPYLIHLCGGNEDQLIEIFKDIQPGDWVFSGHRNHYHALLAGMSAANLEEKIRRGDSMFVYSALKPGFKEAPNGCQVHFLTSAILASMTCIAAGVAWKIKEEGRMKNEEVKPRVWCFLGDGAEEQGHFYEAVLFAAGQDLPVTFIIEDNNRSVDTNKADRRGAAPIILDAEDGSDCIHFTWPVSHVRRYHYTPTYPHAGSGCQHHITFKPR
jgi:pyruvate dehydrogenase E1 component alpha subunit